MTVLIEAIFLGAMMVAAIFAGSNAWSAEQAPPHIGRAVEDRSLQIVIRPAVNLETFEADPSIGGHDLTLADIVDTATIAKEDRDAVMRHLKTVALTDRPKIGEERSFTQDGLEAVVSEAGRRLEAAGYTVDWKVPRRCHIVRKMDFSRSIVLKQLQDIFADRCGGCEVIVRRLDLPSVSGLKVQSWRLNVRAEKPRGSFAVPVEMELEGINSPRKTMMLTGLVELYAEVPVATRAMQASEKFSSSDYKLERRNITFGFDAPASSFEIENSVTARNLGVGEALWKSNLRREQLLRFGDPVRVQVGGETWSVTSEGIAQGPAALGEMVRVKVGKNQKLVSGILKEKGLVEIQ